MTIDELIKLLETADDLTPELFDDVAELLGASELVRNLTDEPVEYVWDVAALGAAFALVQETFKTAVDVKVEAGKQGKNGKPFGNASATWPLRRGLYTTTATAKTPATALCLLAVYVFSCGMPK